MHSLAAFPSLPATEGQLCSNDYELSSVRYGNRREGVFCVYLTRAKYESPFNYLLSA